MVRYLWIGLAGCVLLAAGCASVNQPAGAPPVSSIYVVSHGWHAGIAVRRADVPVAWWPEQQDFPEATFLEVGWGDAAYYPDPDPGLGTTLRAALWPTPSVLHVAAFSRPASAFFPRSQIIRIDLSEAGLQALAVYIHDAYARDEAGQIQRLGPGLYGTSRFYAGQARYHLFNNCNHWTARALEAAGCPISTARALTVTGLLRQARRCGTVIHDPVASENMTGRIPWARLPSHRTAAQLPR